MAKRRFTTTARPGSDELVVYGIELSALRLRFTTEGPAEAAHCLCISKRKVRRLVERAVAACALRLEVEGMLRPCKEWHAAVIAYVAGTGSQHDRAMEAHLAECWACARAVELLEEAARQVAGVRRVEASSGARRSRA